ncbi:neuropeptide-like protein C4orf48 homolog isoform X1 [Lutra lutra]|uniref:neuropeptide-like protein C4orf48 homolog isoform X1 n=1 Tax=Lutra lutra TaxID=9657 RepID=UPI001FD58CDC|nr:neuropeptide-like protein C4orf48 homolog isoform X1 [Lutra lutra]
MTNSCPRSERCRGRTRPAGRLFPDPEGQGRGRAGVRTREGGFSTAPQSGSLLALISSEQCDPTPSGPSGRRGASPAPGEHRAPPSGSAPGSPRDWAPLDASSRFPASSALLPPAVALEVLPSRRLLPAALRTPTSGGPGSLRSAMAPPPLCRLPRSLPPWLLLLLSVALLGFQARAEPATGSAVPAQSRPCVDCHAFEFMQRALQDLRKTAYSLDSRTEALLLQAERRALCACWPAGR